MIGIVILSHGDMAEGMINSVQCLRGETEGMKALCLYPHQEIEEFDQMLEKTVADVDEKAGILIFADIHGGTPANRALMLAAARPEIEVFTGVNLPLLLEAAHLRGSLGMKELCDQLLEVYPDSFTYASRRLREKLDDRSTDKFMI